MAKKRLTSSLLLGALLLGLMSLLAGCSAKVSTKSPPAPAAAPKPPAPEEKPADTTPGTKANSQEAKLTKVKIVTSKGDIIVQLFDQETPITAGNFLLLAESGFYNGLTFHRVVPNFVVQGGDPNGDGSGGPGFTIPDEAPSPHHLDRGILSMARTSAPDSAGSQFFICTGGRDTVGHLDAEFTAFGQVIEGMDVVDKLQKGDKIIKMEVLSESPYAKDAKEAAANARVPD